MPTVDFRRSISVPAPPSVVWDVLTDIGRVVGWVSVLGDVREFEHLARYGAILEDRLGPFKLAADLDVEVVEVAAPSRLRLVADGEDRQVASRIRIEAALELEAAPTGTHIDVRGHYEVTGRVATLGASMIRSKGDTILDEFFASAEEELR